MLKGAVPVGATWWVPIFCANCGTSGGRVPEDNVTFAFYLCQSCANSWGDIAHTYVEPDVVFWQRVEEAQLEKHGRLLTNNELVKALDDPSHPVAKLVKERA